MIKNLAWDFLGKLSGQVVSFIISVLLTRLLLPEEFGIMGMAMSVIVIANVFVGLGFSRAIIQNQQINKVQYNTVFLINTGLAILLTALCYFLAAPLSVFYEQPLIKPVFQALSVTFLLNGLNIIPTALIYKQMNFKIATIFSFIASIVSGVAGVVMAYNGFGVWALVTQAIVNAFISLLLNWFYAGWWPGYTINFPSVKPLWAYGSRMFVSGLLDAFFTRIDAFIIGKVFSPATLGYYTRAQSLDSLVKQFSSNSITSVLFPYIAKLQNEKDALIVTYKKYLHMISFASVGLSAVFFLVAHDMFAILFTARWDFAADLFQLMALSGFAWPVSALMVSIIAGLGNSKAYLRLELLKKLALLPVYVFGFLIGLKAFIIGIVLAYFIAVWLNAKFVEKEIHVRCHSQLAVIAKYIVAGLFCATGVYLLMFLLNGINPFLKIAIASLLFSGLYLVIVFILRMEAFYELKKLLFRLLSAKNDKRN